MFLPCRSSTTPRRPTPGGQPRYSELAVELVSTLRLVFHLALRQAEAFARSVLKLLGVTLPVPDHTTLSRRGRALASVTADGAYDRDPVCRAAAAQQTGSLPKVVIPPRADAVLRTADPGGQSMRDRHIQLMAKRGRMGRQRATGCGKRNHAETTMGRNKHPAGPRLRARLRPARLGEVALAVQVLNRTIRTAKPISVRR